MNQKLWSYIITALFSAFVGAFALLLCIVIGRKEIGSILLVCAMLGMLVYFLVSFIKIFMRAGPRTDDLFTNEA
jgi:lipopolysaccharide export LptBFGC system permease protein LptF